MSETKESMEIKTSDKINVEEVFIQKEILKIHNKGAKSRYLVKKCILPKDARLAFYRLKELISDAKDMLFKNADNNDEKLQEIYKKALTAKTIKPNKRTETVDYKEIGNEKIPVVQLKADDAGECECFQEDIEKTRENFIIQQYNTHLPELEEILADLEKELIQRNILPIERPTVNDIIDKRIKKIYEETK